MNANPKSYGPLRESRCPQCNYKLTGASIAHGEDAAPSEGDFSICANCGQLLVFQSDVTLRKATTDDVRAMMKEPEAWAVLEKAQFFIQRRGRFA
jgi:hypothetical protein